MSKDGKQILARVRAEDDGTNAGFLFNPAVIDGTFQASMAFLELETNTSLRIPLQGKDVTIHGAGFSTNVLVHHEFIESTDRELTVRSQLMDDEGTVLVTMNEMRFREVRAGIDCCLSSLCFSSIFLQMLHLH